MVDFRCVWFVVPDHFQFAKQGTAAPVIIPSTLLLFLLYKNVQRYGQFGEQLGRDAQRCWAELPAKV